MDQKFHPTSCSSPWPLFIPALPFCHFASRSPRPKSYNYPKCLNSLGDHLRARRINLGLFQSQVAAQIGVHELTITNWEGNESQPAIRWIPAIIRFLGYDPANSPGSFPERLVAARRALGLSQRTLASRLGVDPAIIQGWEAGKHEPTAARIGHAMRIIGKLVGCEIGSERLEWTPNSLERKDDATSQEPSSHGCRSEKGSEESDTQVALLSIGASHLQSFHYDRPRRADTRKRA